MFGISSRRCHSPSAPISPLSMNLGTWSPMPASCASCNAVRSLWRDVLALPKASFSTTPSLAEARTRSCLLRRAFLGKITASNGSSISKRTGLARRPTDSPRRTALAKRCARVTQRAGTFPNSVWYVRPAFDVENTLRCWSHAKGLVVPVVHRYESFWRAWAHCCNWSIPDSRGALFVEAMLLGLFTEGLQITLDSPKEQA